MSGQREDRHEGNGGLSAWSSVPGLSFHIFTPSILSSLKDLEILLKFKILHNKSLNKGKVDSHGRKRRLGYVQLYVWIIIN